MHQTTSNLYSRKWHKGMNQIFIPIRSEVEEIFKEKDRDFDGTMSYEEFTGHDTKTELAFRAIDKNEDGYVSKVNPQSFA